MQHLPTIHSSLPSPKAAYPQIPYLCSDIPYSPQSTGFQRFRKFSREFGYDVDNFLSDGDEYDHVDDDDDDENKVQDENENAARGITFNNNDNHKALQPTKLPALLQSWLFFGLLTEVFDGAGVAFSREDFITRKTTQDDQGAIKDQNEEVEEDDEVLICTSEPLQRYIWFWVAAHHHSTMAGKRKHGELVDASVKLSLKVFTRITKRFRSRLETSEGQYTPLGSVLLSIATLAEAVNQAKKAINANTPPLDLHWNFSPLRERLLESGWCVGEVHDLMRDCNVSTLLYLSQIDRRIMGKDHGACTAKGGCCAFSVEQGTYVTKHAEDCKDKEGRYQHNEQCDFVGPDMDEIAAILEDGDIPLIAVDTSVTPSQIEVVRYEEDSEFPYIAMSHVWSDGLGNPDENRLPRCQLERIQGLVNKLYAEGEYVIPFWIDTICVPLTPGLRNKAIRDMHRTYSSAYGVLVLDNSWSSIDVDMVSTEEITMRVRYSPWMSRLWTFQEARLSHTLWFQMKGKQVPFNEVSDQFGQNHALQKLSDFLLKADESTLLAHPNMLQLARALAFQSSTLQASLERYAALPKQEDPEQEEARLSALQILEDQRENNKLAALWKQKLESIGASGPPLAESDEELRVSLSNKSYGVIHSHALSTNILMKGIGAGQTIGKIGPQAELPGHRPAHQLIDVVRGVRARTTSRLEDEAICLSALLGLDMLKIVKIRVMNWRLKILFTKLRDYLKYLHLVSRGHAAAVVLRRVAGILSRALTYAHERRMQVFLSQIAFVPRVMVFWDTPRLRCGGWQWAPYSFLSKELDVGLFKGGPRGYLTPKGLLIKCQAILLSHFVFRASDPPGGDVVRLKPADDEAGLPVCFLPAAVRLHHPLPLSRDEARNSRLQESVKLAILVDGERGVLVSVNRQTEKVTFGTHITTVTFLETRHRTASVSAEARAVWQPEQRMRCIG